MRSLTGAPTKYLLDMDPGVDDALAILLALGASAEIVGLGTSCGNVGAYPSALNALKTLSAARIPTPSFPICVGLHSPLSGWPPGDKPDAEFIHGPGGLGANSLPDPDPSLLSSDSAVDLLINQYQQRQDDLTLVVTGPLTNVAKALRADWRIERNIPHIVFMGGAFKVPGNIAPYAEFNVWMDPVAAAEVFASSIPMTVIGLDVAMQCPLSRADLDKLPASSTLGSYLRDITSHYMGFYRDNEDFDGCYMHDPLAMAVAIWPDLVTTTPYHVEVVKDHPLVRGMTVIDHRARGDIKKEPKKRIATKVNSKKFHRRLMNTLQKLCEQER
jgi:inosine-uridine nucleoside N-ribohydrolase